MEFLEHYHFDTQSPRQRQRPAVSFGRYAEGVVPINGPMPATSRRTLELLRSRRMNILTIRAHCESVKSWVSLFAILGTYLNTVSRSKCDSHSKLKRARTARTEDLRGPAGGLAEGNAREVSVVTSEIRFVVQIKHLSDQRQSPAFLKHERPAQP